MERLAIACRSSILGATLFAVSATGAAAASLTNPGFETGDLTGWGSSGNVNVVACAGTVMGCAPAGGTYFAALNVLTDGVGNASITQSLAAIGPGTYSFGAYVSFGTNNAAANFDQGQISLTAQGAGQSAVVGYDPNSLQGQFTIPSGTFSFTPWFLLSGTFDYSGPGSAPFLININVQDFTAEKGLILVADNAFITAVPLPATLPLFASGLALSGLLARSRRLSK